MENLGKFTLGAIIIIAGFFMGLLLTYVIRSIAQLYELGFITQFSFVQIYGVLVLISLIKYKYVKEDDKKFNEMIIENITKLIVNVIIILLAWGLSFIAYGIIT
jgi:hypothetical protein